MNKFYVLKNIKTGKYWHGIVEKWTTCMWSADKFFTYDIRNYLENNKELSKDHKFVEVIMKEKRK